MKGFIELHRYTDRYYTETDSILVNVSRINTVYRLKYQASSFLYEYITTIFIDNTEYNVEEDYDTVVNMIEDALKSDSLVGELEDDKRGNSYTD
jgi:hypothetical protein